MNQIVQEDALVQISRVDANQLIPSIESAYYGLLLQGKYLPKITSSIITADYLLQVLFDNYYVPQAEEVQIGVLLKSVKKYELVDELMKIKLNNDSSWGIDSKHQPDKIWIINVLKTLVPDHKFFEKYAGETYDMKGFTQDQLAKIKDLDLTMGKKSAVRRFFRVSKEKQEQIKDEKKKLKKSQLERKKNRKNQFILEYQKEIQGIEQKIQRDC